MTQKEKVHKIVSLKNTIEYLYCKEGRSINYISKLLELNRTTLAKTIKEWGFTQANSKHLPPSKQKFLNRNKNRIKSKLDLDVPVNEISKLLGVSKEFLISIINTDKVLNKSLEDNYYRLNDSKENFILTTEKIHTLNGEIWKPIFGYEHYYISNLERVTYWESISNTYHILNTTNRDGKLYVRLNKGSKVKNIQVANLVSHHFEIENVEKFQKKEDENLNTLKEKNQSSLSKKSDKKYLDKFKYIVLDGKYQFKTIKAFAKFIGESENQAIKYINKEVKNNPYDIKIIR